MRRVLVAVLLIMLASPAFADINGAKVLPGGVLRTTIAPTFVTASSAFEEDFEFDRDSDADDVKFFNLGIALEYGVNDWITAAVQWAPGWTIWSDLEAEAPGADGEDAKLHPFFDMFAGAKLQIVGENAPVQRSDMRFAFAPGVKIPLGYPDWDGQYDDFGALGFEDLEDPYIIATPQRGPDTNAFGVGARVFYDYIVNENWFINLFAEGGIYPMTARAPDLGSHAIADALPDYDTDEFGYGWDIEFEVEPRFETMVGPGMEFAAGLPITIDYLPEPTLDGDKLSDIADDNPITAAAWEDEGPRSLLSVGPNVKFFAQTWTVPTEFVAQYNIPVAGRRTSASHSFVLQIRNYLSF